MPATPQSVRDVCPVCNSHDTSLCIKLDGVPVYCNVLYPSEKESRLAPKGDVTLMFCRSCGHLYNGTFDPHRIDYTLEYENSLHYSPRFQDYADNLAGELVERYNLHNKTIVEIACGKGDFLSQLCRLGGNRGIGFDPSYEPGRQGDEMPGSISIVQDYYSEKYAELDADLICCRHALEHIETPGQLLGTIRSAIGDRTETALYFEVPNSLYTLRDLGIWDIIYEHCGYFCQNSLARVFSDSGYIIHSLVESFGKQFLSIEAAPAGQQATNSWGADNIAGIAAFADAFEKEYSDKVTTWKSRLTKFRNDNKSVVVWGAGSKGVTFLNVLAAGEEVMCIVDLNPNKHHKYVPGTGHQVVGPEYLKQNPPDVVLVMNRIYADEIANTLIDMQINSEVVVV